ncbi:hypothetical protein [Alkalihalobacillus pseudalcaliphilus]|uniref:hypothetical protein n=1 Tax=Alkalihalobacillus pseudalcaliphilus TaxID=79884 RepID=UPI00064D9BB2|nr:hypothetical protein [Alkalihalobacillus pseudalcaliphilus]KMK75043.1 hypothetical protein AB990_16370 [Alkalihalobacillus pseudalcaliphilus]
MLFHLKQGDLRTPLLFQASQQLDIDLTFSKIHFIMTDQYAKRIIIDEIATLIETETLSYTFKQGQTDEVGLFLGEFEIHHINNTIENFPRDGYITIVIHPSLRSNGFTPSLIIDGGVFK